MSLYLKHRPKKLTEFVGNSPTVKSISAMLKRETKNIPHAFLFSGPSGCGKTTLARIMAEDITEGDTNNIYEIDSADFRGIETVREIRRNMNMMPLGGGTSRIWIFDEVHQMSKDAQSGLLKALEDTPSHVYFILCTTDPSKLLKTVLNRCTQYTVQPLNDKSMTRLLNDILKKEKAKMDEEFIELIVEGSLGSPRKAIVMLDKLIDLSEEEQEEAIDEIIQEENSIIDLCRTFLKTNSWKAISTILSGMKDQNPEGARIAILRYFNKLMLGGDTSKYIRAYTISQEFENNFYNSGFAGLVLACFRASQELKQLK